MSQTGHPTGVDPAGHGAANTVEACYAAGIEALDAGRLEDARHLAAGCAAAPGGASDPRCAALAGRVAFEDGDFDGAAAHLRRARELAPDDVTIARQLGEALAAGGELGESRAVLEAAARDAPGDGEVLVDLSYVRMLSGDRPAAREAIEQAGALRPDDQAILLAQARIYEALGERDLAAAVSARVARVTTSPAVLNDLARLLLESEQFAEAERAFQRLQVVDPDHDVFAQHGRIWCRLKRGDWRGALELAIGATHADRYELTTALLAYASDRLFRQVPAQEAAAREAALAERFMAAWREHAEQHREDTDMLDGVGEGRRE